MKCPRCDSICATSGKLFVCLHCHWTGGEEQDLPSRRPPKKPAIPRGRSELEQTLAFHLRVCGDMGEWVPEFKFSGFQYRFDFAWPELKLAAEVEGGTWVDGGHSRGKGYEKDCLKYNLAVCMGWSILRFTCDMVNDGRAIETIRKALKRLQEEQRCGKS